MGFFLALVVILRNLVIPAPLVSLLKTIRLDKASLYIPSSQAALPIISDLDLSHPLFFLSILHSILSCQRWQDVHAKTTPNFNIPTSTSKLSLSSHLCEKKELNVPLERVHSPSERKMRVVRRPSFLLSVENSCSTGFLQTTGSRCLETDLPRLQFGAYACSQHVERSAVLATVPSQVEQQLLSTQAQMVSVTTLFDRRARSRAKQNSTKSNLPHASYQPAQRVFHRQ